MVYVGIASVNLQRYLAETVESIKCKDEWKLLLIDNGSIDGTDDWIAQSGHEYILNGENKGVSVAWNQILRWGLSHKDMEAVFIMNNDIHLHPDCMDWLMQAIRDEGKDAVTGVNIGNKPGMLEHTSFPEPRFSPAMNFSLFGLTKPVITRVGFFDEGFKLAYFEDNDYHHRMQMDNVDGVCDMWAPFSHYGSRTIKEGGVKHNEAFEANKKYFYRKWNFLP